jgi:hypothetical protein
MRADARNRLGKWSAGAVLALVAAAVAPRASAQTDRPPPTTEACFSAAEQAQPLMKQRRLRAARRYLQVCAREECPRAARADCRNWLADVTQAEPTLVFVAREERSDGESRAVDDVRVSVDGEVIVPARLEGGAVGLDPGVHTLTFEHAGFDPVEQRIDVREGERDRQVDIVFRGSAGHSGAPPPPVRPAPEPEPSPSLEVSPSRPVPALAYGLGAGAVVALGVGIYMEAVGLSDRSHLTDSCKAARTCAPSDVSAARTRVAAGDIALGASALLFAGAAYVYFSRDPAPSSRAVRLRVGPVAGGVGAGLEGAL